MFPGKVHGGDLRQRGKKKPRVPFGAAAGRSVGGFRWLRQLISLNPPRADAIAVRERHDRKRSVMVVTGDGLHGMPRVQIDSTARSPRKIVRAMSARPTARLGHQCAATSDGKSWRIGNGS